MAVSLVNNLGSQESRARLSTTSAKLNNTIQRLSSGMRINSSGDDAAGLAIANSYRSDITKLNQGVRNANDGVSTLQIVDGGLNTIGGLLDRAMTLATQAASDTFTGDRTILSGEMCAVTAEITRQATNIGLANNSTGGDGNNKNISIYIGGAATSSAVSNSVSVNLSTTDDQVDAAGLGINGLNLQDTTGAKAAINSIKTAVGDLGKVQGKVGAGQNNLSQAIDLATSQITNFQAAESRVRDADIAAEASDMSRLNVLQQAGVSALSQANQTSQAMLSLLR